MNRLKQRIKEVTSIPGNAGYEDEVIRYIIDELQQFKDQITVDSIGNMVLHFTPNVSGKKKVMIFAHLDEVGMMVRRIDEHGFIYAEKLGSLNPTTLQGCRVDIHSKNGIVKGAIGTKSHHYLQPSDKVNRIALSELYVDIGAKNKKDALKHGVKVGTPITYTSEFTELLNGKLSNKAMDDRALVAILLELSNQLDSTKLDCDLFIVFSVQEEFNTRGIMPIVREINPHVVIGLDITPACDTPDLESYIEMELGKGPAITYMNHHGRGTLAGLITNRGFIDFIEQVADKNKIPMQKEVATGILTETAYISIDRVDTVVTNIGLPTRYTHSPIETIDLEDANNLLILLEKLLYEYHSDKEFGKNIDILRKEERA